MYLFRIQRHAKVFHRLMKQRFPNLSEHMVSSYLLQKGKVTNIAEIKYELSVQLQYEQYYAEIEGKFPIFEQKWLALIQIIG